MQLRSPRARQHQYFLTLAGPPDRPKLPRVTASTILSHLLLTGKQVRTSESHVLIIRKPLDRGHELYFGGYIHDVSVCCVEAEIFIEAKCWATQKKSTKYSLRLVFTDDAKNDSAVLDFAVCEGCVAGGDGGLCSHVFALLLVLRFWISVSAASDTILKLTLTFSSPRLLGFWLDIEPL